MTDLFNQSEPVVAATVEMNPAGLTVHPIADYLPEMANSDYEALKRDLHDQGQLEPVRLDEHGQLIDGRHRQQACLELRRSVVVAVQRIPSDRVGRYVFAQNFHRRQLTPGQIAMAVVVASHDVAVKRLTPELDGASLRDLEHQFGVSRTTFGDARVVYDSGHIELVDAVAAGKRSLAPAAKRIRNAAEGVKPKGKPRAATRAKATRAKVTGAKVTGAKEVPVATATVHQQQTVGNGLEDDARDLLNLAVRFDTGSAGLEAFLAETDQWGKVRQSDWQRALRGAARLETLARLIGDLAESQLEA